MAKPREKSNAEIISDLYNVVISTHTFIATNDQIYETRNGLTEVIPNDILDRYIEDARFATGIEQVDVTAGVRNEVVGHIRSSTAIRYDDFVARDSKAYTAFTNGYLNVAEFIETGELKLIAYTPDMPFIFTNQIPHMINVDISETDPIEILKAHAPKCYAFLSSLHGETKISYNLKRIGYLFLRGNPYKAIFLDVGGTDCGKTTYLSYLVWLIGAKNTSQVSIQSLARGGFNLIELKDKLLNASDEILAKMLENLEPLKMLSGESLIDGTKKHVQAHFPFINYAKPFFMGNRLPNLKEDALDDSAFFNRVVYTEYSHKFKKDGDFLKQLCDENEVPFVIVAALRALRQLTIDGGFRTDAEQATKIWQKQINPIYRFIIDRTEGEVPIYRLSDQNGWIAKDDLYSDYQQYISSEGESAETKTAFTQKLQPLFGIKASEVRSKEIRGKLEVYRGITKINAQSGSDSSSDQPEAGGKQVPQHQLTTSTSSNGSTTKTEDVKQQANTAGAETCSPLGAGTTLPAPEQPANNGTPKSDYRDIAELERDLAIRKIKFGHNFEYAPQWAVEHLRSAAQAGIIMELPAGHWSWVRTNREDTTEEY